MPCVISNDVIHYDSCPLKLFDWTGIFSFRRNYDHNETIYRRAVVEGQANSLPKLLTVGIHRVVDRAILVPRSWGLVVGDKWALALL